MPLISCGSAACARERAWTGRGGGDCVWPHCLSWGCINSQSVTRSSVIFNSTVVLAQDEGSRTVKSAVLRYYDETGEFSIVQSSYVWFLLPICTWLDVCVKNDCGWTRKFLMSLKKKKKQCSKNKNEMLAQYYMQLVTKQKMCFIYYYGIFYLTNKPIFS